MGKWSLRCDNERDCSLNPLIGPKGFSKPCRCPAQPSDWPRPHRVSGPFRPETRKESERVPGLGTQKSRKSALKSQTSAKRVQKSGSRLFSDSFGTPGRTLLGLLGPWPGALFPDSFWTLSGCRARRALGDPVWGGAYCSLGRPITPPPPPNSGSGRNQNTSDKL